MARAIVRTYRHGLGDCHLVTLRKRGSSPFRILIDCGVILGTQNASAVMTQVMDDVRSACDDKVDLLVATHEHWDHVSGFIQARDSFARLRVGEVWMGWTEDPEDEQAKGLTKERDDTLALLQSAALRMNAAGPDEVPLLTSLLEFQGAAGRATTKDALEAVRARGVPRYCDPKDPPRELEGLDARIYVLGPPRDMAFMKKIRPSTRNPETYNLAKQDFLGAVAPSLEGDEAEMRPFSDMYRIPSGTAKNESFFQQHYWSSEAWRRIDVAWMEDATQLALALDSLTNNTSLVLAIELGDKDVLLFAADAQVGNWLSWGSCKWEVNGRTVTGHDLLKRTVLYKVGHHGSHNATLRQQGLELMEALETAVIPVDHEMAVKKKWGAMPLDGLVNALVAVTAERGGVVVRTDQDLPEGAAARGISSTALYVEIEV